jgi:hypothetical protein
MIPVYTPLGTGFAFMALDYSQEHYMHFAVALDASGEIHVFDNRSVKFQWNRTMARLPPVAESKPAAPAHIPKARR